MLICRDCEETFEAEEIKYWHVTGSNFEYGSCPYCESPNITQASRCRMCGAWLPENRIYAGRCEECMEVFAEQNPYITIKYLQRDWKGFAEFAEKLKEAAR